MSACRAAGDTLQNTSRTPSSASAGLTWSCGPTDTPPEMITTSDPLSAAEMPSRVARRSSGSRCGGQRGGPGVGGQADQHRRVGVVDLARAQGFARRPQLVTGAEHRDAGPARDAQLSHAGRGGGAQLHARQPGPRLQHQHVGTHVLAGLAHVLARRHRRLGADRVPGALHVLLGDHRGGPGRDGRPGGDADRDAVADLVVGRGAGPGLADHVQGSAAFTGDHGIAVHGGAGEGGDVGGGAHLLGQDAAQSVVESQCLGREGADVLEDPVTGVGDRDEAGGHDSQHMRVGADWAA